MTRKHKNYTPEEKVWSRRYRCRTFATSWA